jgi:hypothetical protein
VEISSTIFREETQSINPPKTISNVLRQQQQQQQSLLFPSKLGRLEINHISQKKQVQNKSEKGENKER